MRAKDQVVGIYLGAYKANLPGYNIIYQDINGKRDLPGDMLCVDLEDYDYIICTPPCNWWSRANWRRDSSMYSQQTKLLLVSMLYRLALLHKPFIVENVRNDKRFNEYLLFQIPGVRYFVVGRHTYWTNICFRSDDIVQKPLVEIREGKRIWLSSQNINRERRQGTNEVNVVIERFIKTIYEDVFEI